MSQPLELQRLTSTTFVGDVRHVEWADSTQDLARAAAAEGVRTPTLFVADEQTAGRGRGTNRWWTGPGSLAISLLFDPTAFGCSRSASPRLSLAAGVAVVDTLARRLPGQGVGLHWPNDVYVGPQKIAGLLVDVMQDGWHILGLGLNTNNSGAGAPDEIRPLVATLRDLTGQVHDHTDLLVELLAELEQVMRHLAARPDEFGRRFDELCLQHGELLTLRNGDQTIEGRCAGVAPDGALVLDTTTGRRLCYSGTLR